MEKVLIIICILFLLLACQNTDSKQKIVIKDTTSTISNIKEDLAIEVEEENSLEVIKIFVNDWNQALMEQDFEMLNTLYDQDVIFYKKEMSREELINDKKEWLTEHTNYRQEILNLSVRQLENSDLIGCVFYKKYSTQDLKDSVRALLKLKRVDGKYLIVHESDLYSEMEKLTNLEPTNLPTGIYSFTHSYWEDVKDDNTGKDIFIRHDMNLNISIAEETVIQFSTYNGDTKLLVAYAVKDVNYKEGMFSVKVAEIHQTSDLQLEQIKEENYHSLKFKTISSKEIALMEGEGIFKDNISARFWLYE